MPARLSPLIAALSLAAHALAPSSGAVFTQTDYVPPTGITARSKSPSVTPAATLTFDAAAERLNRLRPNLIQRAKKKLGSEDDAEDVVSDTFLHVFEFLKAGRYTEQHAHAFTAFVTQVLDWYVGKALDRRNTHTSFSEKYTSEFRSQNNLSTRQGQSIIPARTEDPTSETVLESIAQAERTELLYQALSRADLTEQQRFFLFGVLDGRSLAELAREKRVTNQCARYHYQVALEKLKTLLLNHYDPEDFFTASPVA